MVEQDGDMTPQIVVMSIKSLVELITFIVLPAIYRATTPVAHRVQLRWWWHAAEEK